MVYRRNLAVWVLIIFIVFALVISPAFSQASILGDLNYWYSDTDSIGRWHNNIVIYGNRLDQTFSATSFLTFITHARTQWSGAGISTNTSSTLGSSNIAIYGGSVESIRRVYPGFGETVTGIAVTSSVLEGTWRIKGECTGCDTYMTGREHRSSRIYIRNRPEQESSNEKDNRLRKTFTHELGHALGWRGHSSSSRDVMYHSNTQVTTLTARDKNHISQVYD